MFWRWLCRPSLGRATFAGLFLGLAELAKMVWVVLFVLWPILWVVSRMLGRRDTARLSLLREAGHLAVMLALCLYVINLGYGFDSPFQPLGSFPVGRRILKPLVKASPDGDTAGADAGTRGRRGKGKAQPGGDAAGAGGVVAWLRALPVPLPANYVAGIGEIGEIHDLHNATYLRRQSRRTAGGTTTPMPCWSRCPWEHWVCWGWRGFYRRSCRSTVRNGGPELLLLLTVATILCFINHFGVAQRLRYGLPVLPFLLILGEQERHPAGTVASDLHARHRGVAVVDRPQQPLDLSSQPVLFQRVDGRPIRRTCAPEREQHQLGAGLPLPERLDGRAPGGVPAGTLLEASAVGSARPGH